MFSWLIVNTGWWWLNVLVYIVSGGSFLYICYLLPRYYRDVLKPTLDVVLEELRESRRRNQ